MTTWNEPSITEFENGDVNLAKNMGILLKDDLQIAMRRLAYKTADQSVTSSTSYVNDTELFFPMGSNEMWYVELAIRSYGGVSGDTPGQTWRITVPSDAYISLAGIFFDTGLAYDWYAVKGTGQANGPGMYLFSGSFPTGEFNHIRGLVFTKATTGNFQFMFTQNISSGTATTVKAASVINGFRASTAVGTDFPFPVAS